MPKKYARGSRALGMCGRSDRKMLLQDMVFDGQYPNMLVDPAWYEPKHPQEILKKLDDPVALYRPSPEPYTGQPPVLDAQNAGNDFQITWTAAEPGADMIVSYTLYRSINNGDFTVVNSWPVQRRWDGAILSQVLSYTEVLPTIGVPYRYYVVAHGSSGSLTSNTDEVTRVAAPSGVTHVPSADRKIITGACVDYTNPLTVNWTTFPTGAPLTNAVAIIQLYVITTNLTGPVSITFGGISANINHSFIDTLSDVIPGTDVELGHVVTGIVPLQSVDTTTLPNTNVVINWPAASGFRLEGSLRVFENVSVASNNFGSGITEFNNVFVDDHMLSFASLSPPAGSMVIAGGITNTGDDVFPEFYRTVGPPFNPPSGPPDFDIAGSGSYCPAGGYVSAMGHRPYTTAAADEYFYIGPHIIFPGRPYGVIFILEAAV